MLLLPTSLLMMLAETLGAVNTDSVLASEALTRHLPNVAAAVSRMQLTPAQQQAIAGHWKVWRVLLAPVDKEIAELQQQIQDLCRQDSGAINSSRSSDVGMDGATSVAAAVPRVEAQAASAAAPNGSSGSSACGLAASVPERAAFIETQMQLADRLQVRGVRGAGSQSDSWGGASPGECLLQI